MEGVKKGEENYLDYFKPLAYGDVETENLTEENVDKEKRNCSLQAGGFFIKDAIVRIPNYSANKLDLLLLRTSKSKLQRKITPSF